MVTNKHLIENFIEYKKTTNRSKNGYLSDKTIDYYKKILRYLSNDLNKPFKEANEQDIINHLKGKKPRTKNPRITTFRSFYRYIYNLDENQSLPDCIKRIKANRVRHDDIEYRDKIITEEEYQKLLNYSFSPMHKAIIETFWITGARMGEIISINATDVHYDGEFTRIILRESKSETREFTYPSRAEHLLLWAEELQPYKNQKDKPMFASKYGSDEHKRIHDIYPETIIKRICKRAKIKHITPHDFRHTKITTMLKNGIPETHVKTLLGFEKDTNMFKVYDHNRTKDYEEWFKDKKEETKPSYQLLEKQKKTLEEKHEKEIKEIKLKMQLFEELTKELTKETNYAGTFLKDGNRTIGAKWNEENLAPTEGKLDQYKKILKDKNIKWNKIEYNAKTNKCKAFKKK